MDNQNITWHVAKWPILAWIETIVKGIAIFIGVYTLFISFNHGIFTLESDFKLSQFIIQGLLSLGLVAAIFDRVKEKEIVAMIFVIMNNLGHWGIFGAMTSQAPTIFFLLFWLTMLIGDCIKVVFLRVHNFQVRDTPPVAMYGLTVFYLIGYAALIGLLLV